jgi:uncharacterized RDD family membrane protein YckC
MLLARRVGAYLLDIALLFLVLVPLGQLLRLALGWPSSVPTGQETWVFLVLTFSLATWAYFVFSDSSAHGATFGKRWLGVHVVGVTGQRIGMGRALARTAVKVAPWEMVHLSAFALSRDLAALELYQVVGLSLANGLALVYFVVACLTRGRRSVHDYVAATEVCPA